MRVRFSPRAQSQRRRTIPPALITVASAAMMETNQLHIGALKFTKAINSVKNPIRMGIANKRVRFWPTRSAVRDHNGIAIATTTEPTAASAPASVYEPLA
ncbi:unannotated protein [freshwater metagenome]|uniref:Unannotated protein n=1 Tax=freshwater metagenome TaxID=449393 RepID=A0A6J7MMM8_9ZZZZ